MFRFSAGSHVHLIGLFFTAMQPVDAILLSQRAATRSSNLWGQLATLEMADVNFGTEHAIVTAEQCDQYIASVGCGWTEKQRCPVPAGSSHNDENPSLPFATNDGGLGFTCCCELGLQDPEKAQKSTAVVLREKADHCKAVAPEKPEVYQCHFTEQYACRDQFRSDKYVAEAGGDLSDEYLCCCVLGYWRYSLQQSLDNFTRILEAQEVKEQGDAEDNLMFVHIPKTAGTAIEDVSGKAGMSYPKEWSRFSVGVHMPDGSVCKKYHVPPAFLSALGEADEDVYQGPSTFCVTRHPYERAVSEYLYELSVQWGPFMSEQYRTGLLDYPACTEQGLNRFLHKALIHVKEGRKFLHDCHFVPQADYIVGRNGKRWCHHSLRFDTLPQSFNDLMEDYGVQARLGDTLINNSTATCGGNITVNNLHGDTKRLLKHVYAKDFELFEYTRRSSRRHPAGKKDASAAAGRKMLKHVLGSLHSRRR